jgi:hypothetical protein
MCWINGIYTYRPMRPRSIDLMRIVRLPVDEMSFELAKSPEAGEFCFIWPFAVQKKLIPEMTDDCNFALLLGSGIYSPTTAGHFCVMRRVSARACPTYQDGVAVWTCVSDAVDVSTITDHTR